MRNLILIVILFTIGVNANAQIPKDLGEGEVTIGLFWFPPADTANMDTTRHGVMQFHYHINHDKVFRKGNDSLLILESRTRQTHDNQTVTSHLSGWLQVPTYLIDWNQKTIYNYHHIGTKDAAIIMGPLMEDTQDPFYRGMLLHDTSTNEYTIDTTHQQKVVIAGMVSYKALYKDPQQKKWHQFIYTKETLPFFSPLGLGCPFSFPFAVISCDNESKGSVIVRNNESKGALKEEVVTGIVRVQIIALSAAQQNHSLFELPPDTPIQIQKPKAK